MARKLPTHLKLHTEDTQGSEQVSTRGPVTFDLDQLLVAFTEATGWRPCVLGNTPHQPLPFQTPEEQAPRRPLKQRMRLVCTDVIDGVLDAEDLEGVSVTSEDAAWQLLEQVDALVHSLEQAESVIERQEAQLATSLGVSIRSDESEILASRLTESLHRAAEQTGSDAAAVYLLDETTSELKMRSCWGLPTSALGKPARSLRGSLADLEALMGNAVLLENTDLAAEWGCPEDFPAALCLPIGSPTMPHGTIWLWSSHVRDFSPIDIDSAKAAADKILADIERSVLADEVLKTRSISRQIESASLVQSSRLPDSQPLHEDYEIAGWTYQGQALGGNFHSWDYNRHGQIVASMGDALLTGTGGALVATSLQTVVEACWNSKHEPSQVLRKANDLLWHSQDGDWRSSLAYLQVEPKSGQAKFCAAGSIQSFIVGCRGFRMISGTPTLLGELPDTQFRNQQIALEAGELFVMASKDLVSGLINGGFSQDALLNVIKEMQDEPVDRIADHLARLLPMASLDELVEYDRSLLIFRRRF